MKREKKENLGIGGSLASRILLIATLFLVIPLLALVGLLYGEDARIKERNNYFTLKVLMDQKEDLITGMIEGEREFLAAVSYLLPKTGNHQSTLLELAKREGVSALFSIKKGEDGHFYATQASDLSYLGKDYSGLAYEAQSGVYFIVDPTIQMFYLTRLGKTGSEGWVIAFNLDHLLKSFPIENDVVHPSSTSLVSKEGKILVSTDKALVGTTGRGEDVKIQRLIPGTNFSLLIAAPPSINFVDVPYFVFKVGAAVLLIVIFGGGGAFLLTKKLAKPLRHLCSVMDEVGKGDLQARFVKAKMGFEINVIGKIFNGTLESLEHNIAVAEKERIEKETYEKELLIGQEVQRSILPKQLPAFPGVKMAARFIAAKEVGGDFYDFLVNDKLMLSMADTSGKGISACLYSLSVRSMLRSYGQIHQELDVVLKETNNLFCLDTGDSGMFVTAFVASFDPKTKLFHYSNCGHFPALWFKTNGEVEKLSTQGMALGVLPFNEVVTNKAQLETGDLLVLFTDGIVEAHNDKLELFGEERLIASFQEKKDWEPQKIVDEIIEEVALFAQGCPQHDDLSLLVVKID